METNISLGYEETVYKDAKRKAVPVGPRELAQGEEDN